MSVRATKATAGVNAVVELHMVLTDDAPLESAGAAVRSCAPSKGFMAERATRLQVVVEELIRECRLREAASTSSSDVSVDVSFDGTNLDVTVSDHRLPLTAEQSRHLPSRRLLSLGFADHLHIGFAGTTGNVACCRLTMASTSPDDLLQCVFRCYGYTYPNPSMYQAGAIRRMLESGSMISVVAIAPSGEVVGHVACTFDRPSDIIPEAGKMIVDPRYRGHHLAERLSLKRKEIAAERAIPGMWSETVTNHPASQRLAIERGAAEVGLLIGVGPPSMAMTGLPDQHALRHSLLAVFTPSGPLPPATLSVPDYAASHLATLVERLGVQRQIRTESVRPIRVRSRIHGSVFAVAGGVEVRVQEIGQDITDRVSDLLDEYLAMAPGHRALAPARHRPRRSLGGRRTRTGRLRLVRLDTGVLPQRRLGAPATGQRSSRWPRDHRVRPPRGRRGA